MYSSDTTIEAAALSALESLVAVLYATESDVPTGLAQDITKQCLDILQEPEKSQGLAATKVLVALVRASRSPSLSHRGLRSWAVQHPRGSTLCLKYYLSSSGSSTRFAFSSSSYPVRDLDPPCRCAIGVRRSGQETTSSR